MRSTGVMVGSLVFLLVAPGVVAGVVPWWLTGWEAASPGPWWVIVQLLGGTLLAVGLGVLLHAFNRFVREGRGTPAPTAPPRRLVVGGLYRHVRNPMYVAVIAVILGQALLLARPVLVLYAAALWAAFAAFVRWYEEPALRRRFGAAYEAYRTAVPAWWPRRRPWEPPAPPPR